MSLIEKITSKENIEKAIDTIKKNKGSKTPGVDGKTIEHILGNRNKIVEKIQIELSAKNYQPNTIKRIEIPKENGKTRPLGIPTIYDRIIQQSFKQILEPIIDKRFHPNSFGFRPGRSAENALALNSNLINRGKMYFVVDIDIKGFFDNINHNKLIKQLFKIGIKEKKVLSIIKAMLKAKIKLPCGKIVAPIKGTPQGGILSPLLANVVLNEVDWWIDRQWSGIKLKHEYSAQCHKERALKSTKLSEIKIVRYADDFKLLCRNRETAEKFFKLTKRFLDKRLKLEVSEEKSKIINLKKQTSEFLGFKIKAMKSKKRFIAKSWIKDKAKESIKLKIREQIKRLQKNRTVEQALKFNSLILGLQNYYKMATMCNRDFIDIGYIINKALLTRIGKPSCKKDNLYRIRYPKYNYKVWNIEDTTLFTIQACRFQIPKLFSKRNKASKKKLDILIEEQLYSDRNIVDWEWERIRALIRINCNSKCAVTGEYISGKDEFHIHHILPKKYGGTNDEHNLIFLKPEIHRLLHSKDADKYYKNNKTYQKLLKTLSKLK